MKRWQDFLDSLSTKGGNIACATLVMLILMAATFHVMHHGGESNQVSTVIVSTFTSFAGALLAMLSGNASRQQMVDRNETASGKMDINAEKVQNVTVTTPTQP